MTPSLREGKELLKRKDYRGAVRELKRLSIKEDAPAEAHYLLSIAYMKLAEINSAPELLILSESSIRTAIRIIPKNEDYNNQLIDISSRLKRLDSLSREYSQKLSQDESDFYRNQLKKIAAISLAVIPEPSKSRSVRRPLLRRIVNYIIMPVVTATAITGLINPDIRRLSFPAFFIVGIYILFRIIFRPKSRIPGGWI